MTAPTNEIELDELASEPNEQVIGTVSQIDGPILVAGAGGKMGFHLCKMLRKALDVSGKSNRLIAVSRFGDPTKRESFEKAGIETIPCDLTSEGAAERLPDSEAVCFLAGQKFGTSNAPEVLTLFNETMPARFANRFKDSKIVALSTGCVYPFVSADSGGSRESDPVVPAGDYAISCLGREQAFLKASETNRTPLALIRLNYSVDLRYGVLVDIAHKVFHQQPVDVTMGHLNCIWQGDATRHIICALGKTAPAPDAFILNVTGEKILHVREIASWFGERFSKPTEITGIEATEAWLNNASLSHSLFGAPEISEETLMEWVAPWIEKGRPLLGKPTNFEVRDGKY
ncbi:NAD-dependent epimerase/dehydratase family protein [Verrucomicrobiales bacterium]|nr:NAD-dependent epimerase/dehydratase family protein [Verrucomicrobiales bacterium]